METYTHYTARSSGRSWRIDWSRYSVRDLAALFILAKRALYPFVLVSQTIPIIALSPIFVMWFGYGLTIKVAVIFLFCFFPLVVSTYDGLKVTDPAYLSLFRNLKASKWQIFKYLQWRMALPSVLSGIKLSVIYALMGATVGNG